MRVTYILRAIASATTIILLMACCRDHVIEKDGVLITKTSGGIFVRLGPEILKKYFPGEHAAGHPIFVRNGNLVIGIGQQEIPVAIEGDYYPSGSGVVVPLSSPPSVDGHRVVAREFGLYCADCMKVCSIMIDFSSGKVSLLASRKTTSESVVLLPNGAIRLRPDQAR